MKKFFGVLPPVLVFLLAFAIFAPSIAYPLLDYDDLIFITRNHLVRGGLSGHSVWEAFTSLNGDAAMYSPLLWISWMLDVTLFGATPAHPWPFHFGNVFLHSLNAVLLYFILRRLSIASTQTPVSSSPVSRHSQLVAPFLLALLWALHPLRVESVAWVTERKDTLSTFFAFLSILFYLKAWERGRPARDGGQGTSSPSTFHFSLFAFHCGKGCLCLALAAFAAGLLVKPMLVTLPFLFLLFDVFPLRRIALDRSFSPRAALCLLLEKIPLFILAAALAAVTFLTQSRAIQHDASFAARLALVPIHYAFYLVKTFLPLRLAPFYPSIDFTWAAFLPCAFFAAALAVSAWKRRGFHPAWSLGILAFFGLFVPVIGFFHVGVHHFADRYSYLPAIGLSIAAIPLLSSPSKPLRRASSALAFAALLACVPLTLRTIGTWSSKDAFYDNASAAFPNHPYIAAYRARQAITDNGDFATAEAFLDAANPSDPGYDAVRVLKALCLDERLGPAAAFEFFTSFSASSCTAFELREAAQYAFRAGRPSEVVDSIVDAVVPTLPKSDALVKDILYVRLAAALAADDGAAFAKTAARIPDLAGMDIPPVSAVGPHYLNQWAHLHRRDAWSFFKSLADLPSTSPADLNNIAWFLATAPGWNPAPPADVLDIAGRAAALAPDHPVILDSLAAAYANASDFEKAVQIASRALELAAPDPDLSAEIRERLDLYRKSRPFRKAI